MWWAFPNSILIQEEIPQLNLKKLQIFGIKGIPAKCLSK